MKIALAQIDMRLGDIDAICSRIASQAQIASRQGAQLMCTPMPLFTGYLPGQLVLYPNFEHDLVRALKDLAQEVEGYGISCLVPAMTSTDEDDPYDYIFEAFLLREGRVSPLRRTMSRARKGAPVNPWSPAVFDVAGTRVAVTFDLERDISDLPSGCDLLIYFQALPYDSSDIMTQPARALLHGRYDDAVSQAGVWLACMVPVGGFDEAAYPGGSFVMDDSARVIAQAPSFEEHLLVQDVQRGVQLPKLEGYELSLYSKEQYLWEVLRVHLRDSVAGSGKTRVVVPLSGDLPSSLLAALAVDAVGSRNVIGLLCDRPDALTPDDEAREARRVELARAVADRLQLRLVEHAAADLGGLLDRPVKREEKPRLRGDLESYYLSDVARVFSAYPLSPLTKTEYALCAEALAGRTPAALAPFGDIYLTELEFLARTRNDMSDVIPQELVSLDAVEDKMHEALDAAVETFGDDPVYTERIRSLLRTLDASLVDDLLKAHIDRNLELDETQLGRREPEAASLLLMLVRRGEGARRNLPMSPVVSSRSFSDRFWPVSLAWSDTGRRGAQRLDVSTLADEELDRFEESGEQHGTRVRKEIFNQLGNMLGVPPEQLEELNTDEGQQRMRDTLERLGEQLQDVFEQLEEDDDDFRDFVERARRNGPPQPPSGGGSDDDEGDSSLFSDN